jgi:hypothetical protein
MLLCLYLSVSFYRIFSDSNGVGTGCNYSVSDIHMICASLAELNAMFRPIVGGLLSHPAKKWPDTVGKIAFFHSYPYFLPCSIVSLVPLGACIFTAAFMKEVSVSHVSRRQIHCYSQMRSDFTLCLHGEEENHMSST